MGVSLSTARWLAPTTFAYNFAAQQYGLLSKPTMKDIHDKNISFWSPQPYFIGGFFFPQQIVQLVWMYRLWKLDEKRPQDKAELDKMNKYVPFYALGNVCIGTWLFFWNSNRLDLSNICVLINSFSQLYFVFTQLGPMNTNSLSDVLTHANAKTFAGIGVLDFLHNTSAAYFLGQGPSTAVKVLTGLGFGGLAFASDWIFGGCLVYDLIALSVGQAQYGEKSWSSLLAAYAVGTAAIVGARNYLKPPYVKEDEQYHLTGQDEADDRA